MTKTKVILDLSGSGRYVAWSYLCDREPVIPDLGSIMQVNRYKFKVLEVIEDTVTPLSKQKQVTIRGDLL